MARTDTLGNFLTDVADAIRTKKGTTDTIPASEFDNEIESIGSSEPNKGIIVTEWDSDGYPMSIKIKNITTIGAYYFYCYNVFSGFGQSLVNIEWGEDITSIGTSAFQACTKLKTIPEIPSGVTMLNSSTFYGCSSLGPSITLRGNMTYINNMVFRDCTSLKEVIFEGSATGIQNTVFYGCSNLTKIVFKANTEVPTLNHINSLSATPIESGTGYIYIADDLVEAMKTATNWSTYASQIKPLSEYEAETSA